MENKKIVVFGSYVTDLTGRTPKFPTEGETVMGVSFKSGPGGKGSNQAVAAKRAGGDVTLVTRLGEDDSESWHLISMTKRESIPQKLLLIKILTQVLH